MMTQAERLILCLKAAQHDLSLAMDVMFEEREIPAEPWDMICEAQEKIAALQGVVNKVYGLGLGSFPQSK